MSDPCAAAPEPPDPDRGQLGELAPMPTLWGGTCDEAWADLPVVGVDVCEARAYAAVRGKRLPTGTEWQIAARGSKGLLDPRGNDPAELDALLSVRSTQGTPWADGTHPVGTDEADRSVFGVMYVLSNVDEWTESPVANRLEDRIVPVFAFYIVAGVDWLERRPVSTGVPQRQAHAFRCARSAAQ